VFITNASQEFTEIGTKEAWQERTADHMQLHVIHRYNHIARSG